MFAPLVSVAIDRVRLFENTRLQLSRTEAIGEINRAIYDQSDFDRIVDKICITLIEKFDVKTNLTGIINLYR
jgi:GAF domain-containing protein